MNLKQQINDDLKAAMLAGDKVLAETLKGIKSAILNAEIAEGLRDEGLSQAKIQSVLAKEAKKRQESADLYNQGGNNDKAQAELAEKVVIEKYLPEQMNEDDVRVAVEAVIKETGANSVQQMGQVIAKVREKTQGQADGALIARLVKERLNTE